MAGTLNDEILRATGGPTVNDGLLAFFKAGGAAANSTLPDAERQWLCAQQGLQPSVAATNQDLWRRLLGLTDAQSLNDGLLIFWSGNPLPNYTIGQLFAAGEQGWWYDASDFSTMFQDAAGTTPVTAVEQPVGRMLDKSGRGNHASQATAASRPTLSARVNVLTKTEDFADAAWTKSALTLAASTGGYTKLIPTATNTDHYLIPAASYTTTAGGRITGQVVLKAAEMTRAVVGFSNIAGWGTATPAVSVDLAAGTITGVSGDGSPTATIAPSGDGGWLITWSATPAASFATAFRVFAANAAGALVFTGDATSGILVRSPQLATSAIHYQRVNTATDYDSAGFPLYLRFDGVDDGLATTAINFTATDKMTVFAGVHKASDAAQAVVVELSADGNSNNGTFGVFAPSAAAGADYLFRSKGTTQVGADGPATRAAPNTAVLTCSGDISGDNATLRVNGAQEASNVTDQGAGNFGNYPLYIGRRGGASLPFNGRIYQSIGRGAASTAGQIASSEQFIAGKMQITIP